MTAHHGLARTDDPTERGEASDGEGATDDGPADVAAGDLLSLLGDEYACDILRTLADGPRPARALIEEHEMSRTTVYRRLDRLTDAGIVDSRLRPVADGHHRREFSLAVDELAFRVGADGVDGGVRGDGPASD